MLSFSSTDGEFFRYINSSDLCYPVVLVVKNPSANAGDVRDSGSNSGLERSLEEATTTHSSSLVWRVPRTEKPGRLQSMGSESQTGLKQLGTHARYHLIIGLMSSYLMFISIWVFKITQGSTGPGLKSSWSLNCYPPCIFLTTRVSNLGIILNSLLSLTPHTVLSRCCQFYLFECVASSVPVNLVPVQVSMNSCLDSS